MANIQPSFGKWLPIAMMVGALAAVSVWLTATVSSISPSLGWAGAVWVLFISWGAWFSIGAKMHRLGKFITALTGGVFFGWLTLFSMDLLMTSLSLGATSALAVTVFFVATTIVLLELTNLFELAFLYFFAYAGYFAYVFGGFAGEGVGPVKNAVYFWVLLMCGVVFALVNIFLKNILFKVEKIPLDQRNTLFDKEA